MWGPEAVMRGAGASENILISPFSHLAVRATVLSGPPVPGSIGPPGLAAAAVVLERRHRARPVAPRPIFYVAPRLVACRGRGIVAPGRFFGMRVVANELIGIFLNLASPPLSQTYRTRPNQRRPDVSPRTSLWSGVRLVPNESPTRVPFTH